MRHSTFMPHSLTLLAGAMAALASGQALAETAGKVSFVTGNVTATSPDGQSRALTRGAAINGGDRIETRGGRLQIRFTDGGFVSLQPNSVFGVDQYLYANKAPEETSLFFSLLRGGMRTVTGAIGKVNKQSYKVRTPVATIGIRGTGYRATTDNNRTLVSVGHGLVNVENVLGNITGGAGQNILVTNDIPPTLTRESAEIKATGPEGDVEEALADNGEDDTPAFGEQVDEDGNTLLLAKDSSGKFLFIEPAIATLPNTDTATGKPVYSIVTSSMTGGALTGLAAVFNQGTDPDKRGGLLGLADLNTNPMTTLLDKGTLQFHGIQTVASVSASGAVSAISWGEYTNGSVVTNSLSGTSTLSDTQFESYVIGNTANPDVLPKLGTARYSLLGGTTPRLNQTLGGTLDVFKMNVDFAQANIDIRLDLTMSGEKFMATGTDIGFDGLGSTFQLFGLSTVSDGSSCLPSGCSTNINGFFAGNARSLIGAAYNMFTGLGTISGTAGLGQTSFTPYVPTPTLDNSNVTLPVPSPVFSLAAPIYNGGVANFSHNNLWATFDQTYGANRGGLLTLDNLNGAVFDSGTLNFNNVTTLKNLSWGEFTDGAAAIDNLGSGLVASATQFEPYIVGYSAPTLLGSGKATYNLVGGSTPRLNQTIAATLNNFTITIDFDYALLDLALGVTASGLTANVTGNDIAVPDIFVDGAFNLSTSNFNQLTVSGSACTSFCTADISGFFAGVGGTQIGSAYSILTDVGTIKGVAALDIGTPSSSAGVLPDAQLYTMTTTASAAVLGGYNYGDPMTMSLLADFNASGELVSASETYPSSNTRLQNQTASVADAGTHKTLSWGRFVNGDVLVDGSPVTLAGPDSVHYVIGQETPAAMMSALVGQGGTATYSLGGHTTPTGINGVGSSVSGNLTVDFGAATVGINMDVDMGASLYGVTGSMDIAGAQFAGSGLSTTINGGSCPSGCSTDINGFFSGQQAQQIGLTYKINDFGTDTIKGAATFERGDITLPLP